MGIAVGWDHWCLACGQVRGFVLGPHPRFMCQRHLTQLIIPFKKKNAFFVWLLKYIFSWFTADITGYFSLHCFILFLPSKCCISRACIGMFSVLLFPVPMAFNVISVLTPVKFMAPAPGSTFVYPTSILSLSSILFLGVQSQLNIYERQFLTFNPKPKCPIQVFPS